MNPDFEGVFDLSSLPEPGDQLKWEKYYRELNDVLLVMEKEFEEESSKYPPSNLDKNDPNYELEYLKNRYMNMFFIVICSLKAYVKMSTHCNSLVETNLAMQERFAHIARSGKTH